MYAPPAERMQAMSESKSPVRFDVARKARKARPFSADWGSTTAARVASAATLPMRTMFAAGQSPREGPLSSASHET